MMKPYRKRSLYKFLLLKLVLKAIELGTILSFSQDCIYLRENLTV